MLICRMTLILGKNEKMNKQIVTFISIILLSGVFMLVTLVKGPYKFTEKDILRNVDNPYLQITMTKLAGKWFDYDFQNQVNYVSFLKWLGRNSNEAVIANYGVPPALKDQITAQVNSKNLLFDEDLIKHMVVMHPNVTPRHELFVEFMGDLFMQQFNSMHEFNLVLEERTNRMNEVTIQRHGLDQAAMEAFRLSLLQGQNPNYKAFKWGVLSLVMLVSAGLFVIGVLYKKAGRKWLLLISLAYFTASIWSWIIWYP